MFDKENPFRKIRNRTKLVVACCLAFGLMLGAIVPVLNIPLFPSGLFETAVAQAGDEVVEEEKEKTKFDVVEASIADIHDAIKTNKATCTDIVQAYIDRAAAYNGVCTQLTTEDGAPVSPAFGRVIVGSPQEFPTETVAASTILPNLTEYAGLPLDFGRIETTISDPEVQHQMGMRVGIPDAGQLNALETLNIRGERSVTCKGAFDAHPSTGPLPAGAPEGCEEFRQQPDALERAAELDAQYGSNPPFDELPMYCATVAAKDPYDTKDMRTTVNNDVDFAMDVPPFDSTVIAQLRDKGAIIFAKAQAHEFNAGPGNPGGPNEAETNLVGSGYAFSTWAGQSCNPYDTERVPRGSSSGSGVSVAANLVTVAICEQTANSCQGPASRNDLTLILTTKGLVADSGGIGNQRYIDRAGIIAKTLEDGAIVLDSIKDPDTGYFDTRDIHTAIPKSLVSEDPYVSFVLDDSDLDKNLEGMRIGIIREHMVKETLNHVAMSDQIDNEIKTVLRDQLGAEIVETIDPEYGDDPDVPNLEYTFSDAFSEIFPRYMPEIFNRTDDDGNLLFAVPGWDVSSYEYLVALSNLEAPISEDIKVNDLAGIADFPDDLSFKLEMDRYLQQRGDEKITDWAAWVENAKFRQDSSRAGAENWALLDTLEEIVSVAKWGELALSDLARLALMKVMYENDLDAFVHPENTVPPNKIGGPLVGSGSLGGITPFMQLPQVVVPAGFNQIIFEPEFVLNSDNTNYISVLDNDTEQTELPHPMPVSILFFSGQGEEPTLLKIASAYEAATHHRAPPPAFGPLDEEPEDQFCGEPESSYNVLDGTEDNDDLVGTDGNDLIRGFGGNDTISGNAGNDCVLGGDGNDIINGDAGNDELKGNAGDDQLNGGDGKDELVGGRGDDEIDGGADTDRAEGDSGTDSCINTEKEENCEDDGTAPRNASVRGSGFGTIIFSTGPDPPREFFADTFLRANLTVINGESTVTGRFSACNPTGGQCTAGNITGGTINETTYSLEGTDIINLTEGGPIGPACDDPECDFVVEGDCGEDVTIRFEAPGEISSISQGDVTCSVE